MAEITPSEIKSHFYHLVKMAGGVEAAGAVLGVTAARVSQFQGLNYPDMPSILHVAALEAFVGHSVVFGALARRVDGDGEQTKAPLEEACDVTEASATLVRLVRSGTATPREIEAAIHNVQAEAEDVSRAVRRVA